MRLEEDLSEKEIFGDWQAHLESHAKEVNREECNTSRISQILCLPDIHEVRDGNSNEPSLSHLISASSQPCFEEEIGRPFASDSRDFPTQSRNQDRHWSWKREARRRAQRNREREASLFFKRRLDFH